MPCIGYRTFIPETKIIPNSTTSLKVTVGLEETSLSYFDSLLSAIAMEKEAIVLMTDQMISRVAKTKWVEYTKTGPVGFMLYKCKTVALSGAFC